MVAAGEALSTRDLPVGGKDVMDRLGVPPGPIIGQVLDTLLERVTDDPSLNDRERLLHLIDEVAPAAPVPPPEDDDE